MQEFAPEGSTSEYIGRPVGPGGLPNSLYRHVFHIGEHIMQREYKRADEALDYSIDLMGWLEPNESIASVVAWTDPSSLIITNVEFTDYRLVAWIASGGDNVRQTVYIKVTTDKQQREILYRFAIVTEGTAPAIATVTLTGPDKVYVGLNVVPIPEPVDEPEITVTPTGLIFPLTYVGATSEPQILLVENTGKVPVWLREIVTAGDYHQTNASEEVLQPGDIAQLNITFRPTLEGERSGSITIKTNGSTQTYSTFVGTALASTRLLTLGNQFVTGRGQPVRLRSINWFGAESDIFVPHGLWQRSYKAIIDQIAGMGFNCIRLPLSGDLLTPGRGAPSGAIDLNANPDLVGLTAIEVFDAIINYCAEKEVYVVIDHHRRTAGAGADGSPVSENYTLNDWIASWRFLANRYYANDYVVGADIHNEPHLLTWDVWAGYAEQCGNAIHEIAPDWIIFVEGVGTYNGESYWWGGQFQGVANRPVRLLRENRLAYSPHEYGQSVGDQTWLAYDGRARPANWPMNLYPIWTRNWGFIAEQGIAPIWVGEFGGKFGVDGNGNLGIAPHAEYECQWLYHLELYLNGDWNGDGIRDLPTGSEGISFAYWAFNPNSGDTGGLVQDDWITPQAFKLRLLEPIMTGISLDYLTSLTPIGADDIDDSDLTLVNHAGTDYSLRVSELTRLIFDRTTGTNQVHWFMDKTNPNTLHPGTVWVEVPGLNKTVRISPIAEDSIGTTGGQDSIMVSKANLPAVALPLTGTAASLDLGTKTTTPAGATNVLAKLVNVNPSLDGGTSNYRLLDITAPLVSDAVISGATDHAHQVVLGTHAHNVTGETENMGTGQAINTTNAYIKLAAWYRVS